MRIPLVERLDPQEPALVAFDATVDEVDTRRPHEATETTKGLTRRMRRYFEWCAERGYQREPQFVETETAREYAVWMTTVKRYAPSTVFLALQALEEYAVDAGKFISLVPARGVLAQYRRGIKPQT